MLQRLLDLYDHTVNVAFMKGAFAYGNLVIKLSS